MWELGGVMAEYPPNDVKSYRIYVFGRDGHIQSGEWKEFCDDAQAVAYIKANCDGEAIELWSGTRLVHRLKPSKTNVFGATAAAKLAS
jgi:hypothetical protein